MESMTAHAMLWPGSELGGEFFPDLSLEAKKKRSVATRLFLRHKNNTGEILGPIRCRRCLPLCYDATELQSFYGGR